MYERIMVPLDGSGRAEHALPYAGWLAKRLHSTITLMTACTPNDPVVTLPLNLRAFDRTGWMVKD